MYRLFVRTVDELGAALALEGVHTDELGADHLVDIELIE